MDAACVAVRSLKPVFERIESRGHVLFRNETWRVGEWAAPHALAALGLTRDEAMEMPELNAAALGVRAEQPFLDLWLEEARRGTAFRGDKSEHRHDQSVAGVLAARLGMRPRPRGLLVPLRARETRDAAPRPDRDRARPPARRALVGRPDRAGVPAGAAAALLGVVARARGQQAAHQHERRLLEAHSGDSRHTRSSGLAGGPRDRDPDAAPRGASSAPEGGAAARLLQPQVEGTAAPLARESGRVQLGTVPCPRRGSAERGKHHPTRHVSLRNRTWPRLSMRSTTGCREHTATHAASIHSSVWKPQQRASASANNLDANGTSS